MLWRTPGASGTESSLLTQGSGAASLRMLQTGTRWVCELVVDRHSTGHSASLGPLRTQLSQPSFLKASTTISTQILGLQQVVPPHPHNLLGKALRTFPHQSFLLLSSPGVRREAGPSLSTRDSQASSGTLGTDLTMAHSLVPAGVGGGWKGARRIPWTQPAF